MKKTYIIPVLTVEHVQVRNMLLGASPETPSVGINPDEEVDAGDLDVRGDNAWDIWGEVE